MNEDEMLDALPKGAVIEVTASGLGGNDLRQTATGANGHTNHPKEEEK